MSIVSIPYTFSPGQTIISSQVNSCFSTIYNDYNGNIGNTNLSSSVVIADSKLAQISSASKVNGSALTSLASTPSGAGQLPIANIPTIPSSQVSGSFLGAWSTKATGTIYQAATDGFVTAYTSSSSSSGNLIGLSDSSATPSTVRNEAYINPSSNAQLSIMFPVKKNDYWEVTTTLSATVQWIPLGS